MSAPLFLTITSDRDNEILLQRELADEETIDVDTHADDFAAEHFETTISRNGHVPLGCGDFTVEIAEQPLSAVCWSSRSYFLDAQE